MNFEWDEVKARTNLTKHGVDFADAVTTLEDELAVTIQDDDISEERYVTVGTDALGRILVIIYTWRGKDSIRIISARKATAQERRIYTGNL